MGYTIEASANSQLIEIRRVPGLLVGTIVEVELNREAVHKLGIDTKGYSDRYGLNDQIDWFCWDWPTVVKRVLCEKEREILVRY
jgi:hypothetical protein